MDSLLASYASSDEEDETPKPSSSPFFSLPPPKLSLFSSLPPPKSDPAPQTLTLISPLNPKTEIQDKPSSLFSSIPPPKPKKVIQFKPPVIKPATCDNSDDDDDDVSDKKKKNIESFTEAPSAMSFLSSLPAPKKSSSTLGALPSALGSGRRSILETNVVSNNDIQSGVDSNKVNYNEHSVDKPLSVSSEYGVSGSGEATGWDPSSGNYESYDGNAVYGNYDYYGQYNSNWSGGSAEVAPSNMIGVGESVLKVPGKRGRSEIPTEIVEVKQDELIKNRPREDQIKSTGIAFGPAYQPVSTKGKPSKLQKRKHQIGSLYFDMRQKESELAERRSKGFLTKAETQAKYGW